MLERCTDKNISQCFIDGTWTCVPSDGISKQLVICLGCNVQKKISLPMWFALLQSKTEKAYIKLHQILKIDFHFNPLLITVDFEIAHLNVNLKFFDKSFLICFRP